MHYSCVAAPGVIAGDVRARHGAIAGRRMRIEGNNALRSVAARVRDLSTLELNVE